MEFNTWSLEFNTWGSKDENIQKAATAHYICSKMCTEIPNKYERHESQALNISILNCGYTHSLDIIRPIDSFIATINKADSTESFCRQ